MPLYSYIAYGLGISSEFFLPELVEGKASTDVIIKRGEICTSPQAEDKSEKSFLGTEEEAYRSYAGVVSFLIKKGREIIVDPASNVDDKVVRPYLLGVALGILMHQRGLLALHGSAVSVDGCAVAFLGRSGSGKSTMAGALSIKYPLVTDDIVAVKGDIDTPLVYPAFPQIKLCPDAAHSLGYDPSCLTSISSNEEKRAARMEKGFSQQPLPLGRVYILEEGISNEIQAINRQDAMMALVNNTYTRRSLKAGVKVSSHFLQCAKVAKYVPVRRLIRPLDLKTLPKVAHMIEEDLKCGD